MPNSLRKLSLTLLTFNFETVNKASGNLQKVYEVSQPVSWRSRERAQTQMCNRLHMLLPCANTHAHSHALTIIHSLSQPLSYPYPCAHITHHMAETHAKSLLKQKVVKSERNQFKSEG